MTDTRRFRWTNLYATLVVFALIAIPQSLMAHDLSQLKAIKQRIADLRANSELARQQRSTGPTCALQLRLLDQHTRDPIPALVRIERVDTGEPIALPELILRKSHWHTSTPTATVTVPQTKLRISALRGVETLTTSREIDLSSKAKSAVEVPIRRIYNARERGWRNGNTHLHLMKLTIAEADRYLRQAPASDDLELVFLSHLRRIPDEQTYISNLIVENSLPGGDLARLSQTGVLFSPGEEHRHNFGRGGEGYGHVMLLDIQKLIRPVSIGPGIMRSGTDGIPLQRGIREARKDGGTVVWCHNTFGLEDIPNWTAGLVDAQNIFDGGNRGSYEESYYRYLNLGMKAPFSTGTDWFIDDFSRVYVPLDGKLTSKRWLAQLKAGRSFITNGPLLEFEVDGHAIGDTIDFPTKRPVKIRGRGVGRLDFERLELVHNGKVVATSKTKATENGRVAELSHSIDVSEPGWVALRTPLGDQKNELGNQLYSHTSPVYLEFSGQRIFRKSIAREFIDECRNAMKSIEKQGVFADEAEQTTIMKVYRTAIKTLEARIREHSK